MMNANINKAHHFCKLQFTKKYVIKLDLTGAVYAHVYTIAEVLFFKKFCLTRCSALYNFTGDQPSGGVYIYIYIYIYTQQVYLSKVKQ